MALNAMPLLIVVILPPAGAYAWQCAYWRLPNPFGFFEFWFFGAAGGMLAAVANRDWPSASAGGVSALIAAFLRWRRRRRRLLSLLAGKYAYIRDRMVRVMREGARPRPVFRPAPGRTS